MGDPPLGTGNWSYGCNFLQALGQGYWISDSPMRPKALLVPFAGVADRDPGGCRKRNGSRYTPRSPLLAAVLTRNREKDEPQRLGQAGGSNWHQRQSHFREAAGRTPVAGPVRQRRRSRLAVRALRSGHYRAGRDRLSVGRRLP